MAGHTPTPEHALELQLLHQRLHEADQRLQALGRNLPGSVIYQMVRDADGRRYFAYMGEAIEAIVGLKAEDVLRDAAVLYRRILPEDMPAFLALADQSYHELCTVQTQARLRRMDGEVRWMRMASTPRALEHGGVIWDGLLTDITEQIRAEAVTRAYENQLAGVLRHLPGAVARIGLDLEVLYANDTQARWVDSTVEQMIGRRMPEFITPGLMDRMLPFLRRAMNGEMVVFSGHPAENKTFDFYMFSIGRPELCEDPRFATTALRLANLDDIEDALHDWARTMPSAHAIEEVMSKNKLAVGRLRSVHEVCDTDWGTEREVTVEIPDRGDGTIRIPNAPWRFEGSDIRTGGVPQYRGEDNRGVLKELLGLDDATVDRLAADGVISDRIPQK